jgi:intraflagellar transport protein 52
LTPPDQEDVELPRIDEDAAEYAERVEVPNTAALGECVQSCLQESEELPTDFTTMFDGRMFSYDVQHIPDAVRLFKSLDVSHQPLTLITPQFEVPMPPLQVKRLVILPLSSS